MYNVKNRTRKRSRLIRRDAVTAMVRPMRDDFDLVNDAKNYEGQLIRVDRDKVYLVTNGKANYVASLPLPDGRGWESVIEVGNTKKLNVIQKTVSKLASNNKALQSVLSNPNVSSSLKTGINDIVQDTVIKSPQNLLKGIGIGAGVATAGLLLPVAGAASPLALKAKSLFGGGTPVTNPGTVTTAITSTPTNSTLADQVLNAANNAAPNIKQQAISQGKQIITDKLGGWLTDASMLPKTQGLKDAEKYVDSNPQSLLGSVSQSTGMQLFDGSTTVLIGIIALVLVAFIFKQN